MSVLPSAALARRHPGLAARPLDSRTFPKAPETVAPLPPPSQSARSAVAAAFRATVPDILDAYRATLCNLGSPLAVHPDAWVQCRHQAQVILAESAQALETGRFPRTDGDYTRLLVVHRTFRQIPAAERVLAVALLWRAVQTAAEAAADQAGGSLRTEIGQMLSAAFLTATGSRFHQDDHEHDEAQRVLITPPPVSFVPGEVGQGAGEPSSASALLTPRECEVLRAAAHALTNRQIARRLGISEATVKRHLTNVFHKLNAHSRIDAIRKAFGPS